MVQAFLLSEGKDTKSLIKQKNILCFFSKKDSKERFLPTFATTCTLYLKPSGMPINTGNAERYMLFEHVPKLYPNMYPNTHHYVTQISDISFIMSGTS